MLWLLLRRHLRTAWGTALVLALVTVLAAGAATAATRAIAEMRSEQVTYATEQLSPQRRDVSSRAAVVPGGGVSATDAAPTEPATAPTVPPEPRWAEFLDGMVRLRDDRPQPLRDVLGEPSFAVSSRETTTEQVPGSGIQIPQVVMRATARMTEDLRLVEGEWPVATPVLTGFNGPEGDEPVQVVLSRSAAETLGWELGGTYAVDVWKFPPLRVVGLTEPVDPDASAWYHQPFGRDAQLGTTPSGATIATAAVYVYPAMIGSLAFRGAKTELWYPVAVEGIESDEVAALADQVRGLTHETLDVLPGDPVTLQGRTSLSDVLDGLMRERVTTDAVLAVLVVGPLGALGAVMVLAARLVVERRRSALAVLLARGATGTRLRMLTAAEGLVVTLPAAVVGVLLGLLVRPGAVTGTQVVWAAAAALAPAAAAAAVTVPRALRGQRRDLAPGAGGRRRRTAELAVIGLAALAVVLLARRGVVGGAGYGGVDPLVAATPLLVAVAAALVAVRVVPLVARGLERLLSRRRDLVPFLGAARATRAPAGGVVPALALVLAVSVGASSAVLLSTVDAGVARQAHVQLGADLRVSGPALSPEDVAALRRVDGVAGVATTARVLETGRLTGPDGRSRPVQVLAVDAAGLATVQDGVPEAPPGVAALARPAADGALPLLALRVPDVAAGTAGLVLDLQDETADVVVAGATDQVPGVSDAPATVVLDAGILAGPLDMATEPHTALVALEDGADPAQVTAALRAVVPRATVDDRTTVAAALLDSPAARGIATGARVSVALSGGLVALTVALTLVLAAPDRERLLAVLRSMGLRRGETRGLVAWEVAPWALGALVVGGLVGAAVPALLRARVDLTSLTGGGPQPALAVDPVLVVAGVAGFVVTVVVGAGLAAVVGRRGATPERLREAAE
ncbi:FtsX-like permease family protein [Krasilnikoviella flava]|uniref:Putative ABC transport system permease protein n=1 Tax=Krasilnikoviella flava TaxID=526729 RepID=A0A1T5JMB7_9MICO|nr:FtsX-like permease family protein [Krasilnikoviella flava]SKC52303.1 putative ABC transport system permease protein [Krasilnikoviella flava]